MTKFFERIPLRQIPELDTIRFFSIFLVVLHHQFLTSNPFLQWFTDHGWIGVDIFFGMSGFLITSLLLKEIEKTDGIKLKTFWFRRMLRLWPSWFFTLLLSFTMVFVLSRNNPLVRTELWNKWWHYFLHFGNYSYIFQGKIHTLYSHFWSLAVEEHFYLLWPLVLITIRTRKWLLFSVWSLILASLIMRFYHLSAGASNHLLSFSTHTRMDELLLGCLLALYFSKIKSLTWKLETFLTVSMFSLYGFALYVCAGNRESILLNSLTYSLIGLANCLLIIVSLRGGTFGLRRTLSVPLLARLGVLSYGVYLIHLHINYLVFPMSKRFSFMQDDNTLAFLNLVIPFIPAYFMYFYLDEYFAKFKHRKVIFNPKAKTESEVSL